MKPISATTFALVLLLSTAAHADQKKMTELNEKGDRAFDDGEYARAAEFYDKAYQAEPHDSLLKNLTIAYFKAADCPKALESAERFLVTSDDKDPRDIKDIRKIRAVCHTETGEGLVDAREWGRAIERLEIARKFADDPETITRIDGLVERAEAGRAADRAASEVADVPEQPDVESESDSGGPSWPKWVGGGAIAVGTGLVGFQLYQSLVAGPSKNQEIDELKASCDRDPDTCDLAGWRQLEDEVEGIRSREVIMYSVGALLVTGGVVLLTVDFGESAQASLVPVVGPSQVGLQAVVVGF